LVPPIARAACRAACTQNAFVKAVKLLPLFYTLQELALFWRIGVLKVGLDGFVLLVELCHVGDEVLNDIHCGMCQKRELWSWWVHLLWGRGYIRESWLVLRSMRQRQARVFWPLMFIAHEPQMPSRHERRNVSVGSTSFLILIRASRTWKYTSHDYLL
jgi:hypothetical protein